MKTEGRIRIGTCSWKYPSWAGLVYSSADKSLNHLSEYARRYETVEIDQWFWSLFPPDTAVLPRRAVVDEYAAAVPEGFRFTIKVPNAVTLTHFYREHKEAELVANPHFLSVPLFTEFLKTLLPFGDRIGMLMFQFEYINRQKQSSQTVFLKALGNFLSVIPRTCPIGIETRNPNYLNRVYFDFLKEHRAGHVFLQGYYMPDCAELYARWKESLRGFAAIRLHGYDRDNMEKVTGKRYDRIVAPKDRELSAVAAMARNMRERGMDVFLNVNNHYEGSAPLTIEKLAKLLYQAVEKPQ